VEVLVDDAQEDLAIDHSNIQAIIESVLHVERVRCNTLSVCIITNELMCKLHEEHFDDPSPTDCITFPIDPPNQEHCFLGELFICPKVAIEYCQSNGGDPYEEVTLYLVHCLLHLLGYNDIEDEDRQVMRNKESEHMLLLKKKDILLKPTC